MAVRCALGQSRLRTSYLPSLAGRLLLGRCRGGLQRTLASPPAVGADSGAASRDALPRATQDDRSRRRQEARQEDNAKRLLGGLLLASAVFSAFTGSPGAAIIMLIGLAYALYIFWVRVCMGGRVGCVVVRPPQVGEVHGGMLRGKYEAQVHVQAFLFPDTGMDVICPASSLLACFLSSCLQVNRWSGLRHCSCGSTCTRLDMQRGTAGTP